MSDKYPDAHAIFNKALELNSDAERSEYLDDVCRGNPQLRDRIETLLGAHQEAGSFLWGQSEISSPTDIRPISETPGDTIGPYKLLQQIGEGGMGTVFMAEQSDPVERRVALKIIKPGMDTLQVIARFEAERQALAMMDHPNIAKVLDAGTTETSRPYFVMELVKGMPVTQYCDEQHLSPRERLELFLPICHAVQHAHQKGIIHRDLKPSNILIAQFDDKPVAKIIDFGVAKAVSQKLTEKTMFTQYGQIVGTIEYMSPEQARFNQLDVDTRSDIYSLGVLLYELLTGETPFDKTRLRAAAFDELLRIIRDEEPPRMSIRLSSSELIANTAINRKTEPKKLSLLVRGELDWIVMKALEKDRGRRYETANGFAADVQHYLNDEPVTACPPSAVYRFRKFARRNKRVLSSVALLLVAVLVVAGTLGWAIRDRESQAEEVARERTMRKVAIQEEVNLALKEAQTWQEQRKWPEALSAAKRAQGLLVGRGNDELLDGVHQLRKDLEFVLRLEEIPLIWSEWKIDTFDFKSADREYAKAFDDYGIDVSGLPVEEAAARIRARAEIAVGVVAALDDWADVRSHNDAAGAQALSAVAQAADRNAWRRQVREAVKQRDSQALEALAASTELLRQPPATLRVLAKGLQSRGNVERQIDVLRQAQQEYPGDFWINFELAFALDKSEPSPFSEEALSFHRIAAALRPNSSAVHTNLGNALSRQNRLPEAVAACQKAVELDPKNPRAYSTLATVLIQQKKLPEAIAACQKAIELDPKLVHAYYSLGGAFQDQNKLPEAIAEYHKVIELDPQCNKAYTALGGALRQQGQLDEAIAAVHKAIEVNPKDSMAYNNLGNALWDQKKLDEAVVCYQKSIELNPKHTLAHANLGNLLREQGKLDEAVAAYCKAIEFNPKAATAHISLGAILCDSKCDYDGAIAAFRKAIELDPKNAIAHNNLGVALQKQGNLDDAIATFCKAIELDPKAATAHNSLGFALYTQGKLGEAIVSCRRAIELDPKLANAHNNLGLVLHGQGQIEEAKNCYRKAIELDPKFADPHSNLGVIFAEQQKLPEAIAEYHKAIEIDSRHRNAHFCLGNALLRQQKCSEAIPYYRKVLELDPEFAEGHSGFGLALMAQGKFDESIVSFRRAAELDPQSIVAWQWLGWAEYRAGHWTASIEALEKSCQLQNGGDAGQWIVMSLAHGQLANNTDLPDQERARQLAEARRFYEQSAKQIDTWGQGDSTIQAIRDFRTEADELFGIKKN